MKSGEVRRQKSIEAKEQSLTDVQKEYNSFETKVEQNSSDAQAMIEQNANNVQANIEQKQNTVPTQSEHIANSVQTVLEQNLNTTEQTLNTEATEMNKGKEIKEKEIKNISSSPPKSEISEEGKEFSLFFKNLLPPTQKVTDADLKNWADTFDKLIRIDKRPREEIYQVTEWARKDSFWGEQGNFLSACKLRSKSKDGVLYYDIFLQKFKRERSKSNGTAIGQQVQRPAWITAKE